MSNNTPIPPILPGDGEADGGGTDATKDVDGVEVLDDDANEDLIDSADADEIAAREPHDQN